MSRLTSLLLTISVFVAIPWPVTAAEAEKAGKVKTEKIEVADLPAQVKAGFSKAVPNGEIIKVEKIAEEKPVYRIYWKVDGKEAHSKFDSDGNRLAHPKKGGAEQ